MFKPMPWPQLLLRRACMVVIFAAATFIFGAAALGML